MNLTKGINNGFSAISQYGKIYLKMQENNDIDKPANLAVTGV